MAIGQSSVTITQIFSYPSGVQEQHKQQRSHDTNTKANPQRDVDFDKRLTDMNIELPPVSKPVGIYKRVVVTGNMMRFSAEHFDLALTREYFGGLLTFQNVTDAVVLDNGTFLVHMCLALLLVSELRT